MKIFRDNSSVTFRSRYDSYYIAIKRNNGLMAIYTFKCFIEYRRIM